MAPTVLEFLSVLVDLRGFLHAVPKQDQGMKYLALLEVGVLQ